LVPKEKRTGRNKVAMRRSKEEARERREDVGMDFLGFGLVLEIWRPLFAFSHR
jgi:hypothetical protein